MSKSSLFANTGFFVCRLQDGGFKWALLSAALPEGISGGQLVYVQFDDRRATYLNGAKDSDPAPTSDNAERRLWQLIKEVEGELEGKIMADLREQLVLICKDQPGFHDVEIQGRSLVVVIDDSKSPSTSPNVPHNFPVEVSWRTLEDRSHLALGG